MLYRSTGARIRLNDPRDRVLPNIEDKHLFRLEVVLYVAVGILLSADAIFVLVDAGAILWRGIANRALSNEGLSVLNQLLLVLMLIEVLHTIRISMRSKELILIEPFLIVGLIASIRRVLVITMQAARLSEKDQKTAVIAFRNDMIELGLLGFLVLIFVISIYLLHRTPHREELQRERLPD